jgi:hypothetical protein
VYVYVCVYVCVCMYVCMYGMVFLTEDHTVVHDNVPSFIKLSCTIHTYVLTMYVSAHAHNLEIDFVIDVLKHQRCSILAEKDP